MSEESVRMEEAGWVPVCDEALERFKAGLPIRDVGEIDMRAILGVLDSDRLRKAREDHRARHRYGHEAPILLRESQAKALAREFGHDPDDKDNPLDLTQPGSTFMGHELICSGDSE